MDFPITEIITFINANALKSLVTLKTLNALKILKILTVLNALTALPFCYVVSSSLEVLDVGMTNSTIDNNTISPSKRFILSPA